MITFLIVMLCIAGYGAVATVCRNLVMNIYDFDDLRDDLLRDTRRNVNWRLLNHGQGAYELHKDWKCFWIGLLWPIAFIPLYFIIRNKAKYSKAEHRRIREGMRGGTIEDFVNDGLEIKRQQRIEKNLREIERLEVENKNLKV